MNEIALLDQHQISSASTEKLKEEFSKSLKITADRLAYMAMIYTELSSRGVDLSGLKGGLMEYMPLIANNQLAPRLVIEYAGNKTLLSCLAKLDISQQEALIANPKVEVVELDENESMISKQVDLDDIRSSQIYQVFDSNSGEIRSNEEQYKQLLIKTKNRRKTNSKNRRINQVKIKGDWLVVGKYDISVKSILQALSERDGVDYFSLNKNAEQ